MNCMKEVAKLLDVELGEKFKINCDGDISSDEYYIDETSIHEVCDESVNDYCCPLLIALLNGSDTVVKLPKAILSDAEKKYLSAVIKPFRDRVRIIYKFQDDHDLVYKSTLWESVKISFQTVEYTKTIPYDPLPSDYIRVINEYTLEHTLLILIITYILATEISTQLKFIEYKRDRIYSNCTDDGITPEDNIGIAEIKKIAYTLRYDELKDLIKWLDDFTNDRINKMDNIC